VLVNSSDIFSSVNNITSADMAPASTNRAVKLLLDQIEILDANGALLNAISSFCNEIIRAIALHRTNRSHSTAQTGFTLLQGATPTLVDGFIAELQQYIMTEVRKHSSFTPSPDVLGGVLSAFRHYLRTGSNEPLLQLLGFITDSLSDRIELYLTNNAKAAPKIPNPKANLQEMPGKILNLIFANLSPIDSACLGVLK
jgi:hypothetical protein